MRNWRPLTILLAVLLPAVLAAAAARAAPQRADAAPAEPKLAAFPDMEFYLARGDANACGHGCDEWIAAEGKIVADTAQHLRRLLVRLGTRRPPIYFHSPGGAVAASLELGRLIRARKLETGVARTIPAGCDPDKPPDKSCEVQKRSGHELRSEFDPGHVMCNSACVFALAGGVVRHVPPGVKPGVHDVGFDAAKQPVPPAVAERARRLAHVQIEEYFREMGIDHALFTAIVAVPNNSRRFLEREELARFGLDRREFGETSWRFIEQPRPAVLKGFFVRAGTRHPQYVNGFVSLDCPWKQDVRVVLAQEHVRDALPAPVPSIGIGGRRIALPYQTTSARFYARSARLAERTFDTVGEDTKFEVPGNDLARADEPAGDITLNMDGFSRAYAKLHGSCAQATAPGQLTAGPSGSNPNANSNCRPGGGQPECVQIGSGPRPAAGQSATAGVLPSASSANVIRTVPIRPDQTRTADNKPEPSGSNPPNSVRTVEAARAVPIDHQIQLDFVYALNPDCSSVGIPTVRVIEQAHNGDIAIEDGTGYSNFPPDNQRYECNKRKSEGAVVRYKPHPGFAGTDSVTLDFITPRGQELRRHFSIEVK